MKSEWWTPKESAEYIRLNYRLFLRLVKKGDIRSIRRENRFFTKKQWLDDYMESLEVGKK